MFNRSKLDLFYCGSGSIGSNDWEEIVQSLCTASSTVWMNSNYQLSPFLPPEAKKHIVKTLHQLKEAGILQVWQYEQLVTPKNDRHIDKVIPSEDTKKLNKKIISKIEHHGGKETNAQNISYNVDQTAKIINFKSELQNIGLTSLLKCDGLSYGWQHCEGSLTGQNYYRYEVINKEVIKNILNEYDVAPLGFLNPEEIIELNKSSRILFKRVTEFSDDFPLGLEPDSTEIGKFVEEQKEIINSTVEKALTDKSTSNVVKKVFKNTAVAIAGLSFPIIGLLPIGEDIYSWLKENEENAVALYMHKIQTYSKRVK